MHEKVPNTENVVKRQIRSRITTLRMHER